jgi:hypothetical protein
MTLPDNTTTFDDRATSLGFPSINGLEAGSPTVDVHLTMVTIGGALERAINEAAEGPEPQDWTGHVGMTAGEFIRCRTSFVTISTHPAVCTWVVSPAGDDLSLRGPEPILLCLAALLAAQGFTATAWLIRGKVADAVATLEAVHAFERAVEVVERGSAGQADTEAARLEAISDGDPAGARYWEALAWRDKYSLQVSYRLAVDLAHTVRNLRYGMTKVASRSMAFRLLEGRLEDVYNRHSDAGDDLGLWRHGDNPDDDPCICTIGTLGEEAERI